MGSTAGDAYYESCKVIETIKRAWEAGHTLVPLLGAGISVDSGMPLVDSIMTYLVMIRQYVQLKAYRPDYRAAPYESIDDDYQRHPIRYIRHFGWPDRFQLRHELMLQYSKLKLADEPFDQWISQKLDDEVSQLKRWQKDSYERLKHNYECLVDRYKVLHQDRARLAGASNAPRTVEQLAPQDSEYRASSTWEILGDWRAVIRDFTEFTLDDADSLFERLYRWHKPGRSHHFWAFLTRLMGLRLFLTTNFDNFLERAFVEQGIDHRVFGVTHGDILPHESLVRETVSVIKLHGDTHQLLLDEKLDYPPGPEYLDRLQACMPRRPIMLVMGCGGNDPRILEVVKSHAIKNYRADSELPTVIWLHFEPRKGERPLEGSTEPRVKNKISYARVTNPGLFLLHLYAFLRNQHPASRVPYQTHLAQPIAPLLDRSESRTRSISEHRNARGNVIIFKQHTSSQGAEPAASQVMADLVYRKKTSREGYIPIWINLEAHHSVAGVVEQIVEQCRVHDTFVSPFDVPFTATASGQAEADDGVAALTAERLFHILRRGRYVLAFDALEAFLWPPTAHHGRPEGHKSVDIPGIKRLFVLLTRLMAHEKLNDQIDVVLCASFDRPRGRDSGERVIHMDEQFEALVKTAILREVDGGLAVAAVPQPDQATSVSVDLEQELFIVSCFRRPRHLVLLRGIFSDAFPSRADSPERRIKRLVDGTHLYPAEGGYFRMRRGERDAVYASRSAGTRTGNMKAAIKDKKIDELVDLISRCYALASTHGYIARHYYMESYLHSLDAFVFIEYFYHRVSSLRYITKLVVLLAVAERMGAMDRTITAQIPPADILTDKNKGRKQTLTDVQDYVVRERGQLFQSLKHALGQAQRDLLRGLPAAQLAAWCDGVLRDSFSFSIDARSQRFDFSGCRLALKRYAEGPEGNDGALGDITAIFCTLLGLLRKSLYEQGRNDDASRVAWLQVLYKGKKGSIAAWFSDLDVCHFEDGHRGLAVAERVLDALIARSGCAPGGGAIREQAGGTPDVHELEAVDECIQSLLDLLAVHSGLRNFMLSSTAYQETDIGERARTLLRKINERYRSREPGTLLGRQNRLRALCMLAEWPIKISSGGRFFGQLDRDLGDAQGQACDAQGQASGAHGQASAQLELAETALELCRVVSPEGARDSSHDPYYLRFRGRLLMAKARLKWVGATGSAVQEPMAVFREADQFLESARASMSPDDHVRLARLEMTWAEGLLLQANFALARPLNGGAREVEAREEALAGARVDYLRAGDALQRARDHLMRGSRDVECWASYQRLWAQYQAEWCLFHLAHLENRLRGVGRDPQYKYKRELAELTPRDTAGLLKRLKRGLNGLQAALVIRPGASKDPWLRRIWLELLCAGMVYGVTTAAGTSFYEDLIPVLPAAQQAPRKRWLLGIDKFWEHWRVMNQRAGIPDTIESEGTYCDHTSLQIAEPSRPDDPWRDYWRETMIEKLLRSCSEVSMLRSKALSLASDLHQSSVDELPGILTDHVLKLVSATG